MLLQEIAVMPHLTHRNHLQSLDGIRGLAFLMVFFFHEYPGSAKDPISRITTIGWTGVDLFFVLSGFLITGILYDTLQQPYYFRNFYARRGLRLFPVYMVVVCLMLGVNYALGGRPTIWALPYFIYGSNIIQNLGKNIGISGWIGTGHLWSLAIEEQFYLFWPLVIAYVRTKRRILWVCCAGSVLAVVLRWVVVGHTGLPRETPYVELPMRLDNLLFGGAIAIILRSDRVLTFLSRTKINWGVVAGATILVLSVIASRSASAFEAPMVRYGYLGSSILFASLIVLAIQPDSWAHRLGSIPLLRTFGRYSYGLYLIHFLPDGYMHHVYDYLKVTTGTASDSTNLVGHLLGVAVFLVYLALLLGVAAASYHTIELPLLGLKRHFAYSDERKVHHLQSDQSTVIAVEDGG